MKKVALYLRVSTKDQTTDNQLHAIEKYCLQYNWQIKKIFTDEGISGSVDKRPQLDELKEAVKVGKFDCIVVFKFDRLARSTSHLLSCLKLFQQYDCDFVSVTEGIDTSTNIGKMIFTFLGAIAEFERTLIQERIKCALDFKKKQGVKLGRPRKGFDIKEAVKLKLSGLSWNELSKRMGVSSGTLRRVIPDLLKNPEITS